MYDAHQGYAEVFLANKTSLSGMKVLAYYDSKVPFTVGNTSLKVSVLQFLEYFYAAV